MPMQRMSRDEIETLPEKGVGQVEGLTAMADAKNRIIYADECLPHFAHLLGLRARGRPSRALGADLDPRYGMSAASTPGWLGRSPHHPRARARTLGTDRDVDRGPRWRPDRPGRGTRRSPSAP